MSKKEKEQKAKEFWDYYLPTQGTLTVAPEFFLDDDCPLPKSMLAA
jgi:hypothetical protein